jgi:hypothetical protein
MTGKRLAPRAPFQSCGVARLRAPLLALCLAAVSAIAAGAGASAADRTIARDDFSRTVTGTWGSAQHGGRYSLVGPSDSFSVNGSAGIIAVRRAGSLHSASLPNVATRDVDMRASFSVSRLPSRRFSQIGLVVRAVDRRNHYHLVVRVRPNGEVVLRVVKMVDGSSLLIGKAAVVQGVKVLAGRQYRLRFRVVGTSPTSLRAKIWQASGSEPSGWSVRRSDNTAALRKSGSVGIRAYAPPRTALPHRFTVDNLVVRAIDRESSSGSGGSDYLLMPRSELLKLSTSSRAWTALKKVADESLGRPDLCDKSNKHGVRTLAVALVYARTGQSSYYTKARNAIMSAIGTERVGCSSAILALGRQLGAYGLAEDDLDVRRSQRSGVDQQPP